MSFQLSPQQEALQDVARNFAKTTIAPQAAHYDQSMEFPKPVFEQAWKLGLCNTHIPPAYGGAGLTVAEELLIGEELAWGCAGMAIALSINSIVQLPLVLGGNEAQKKKYLGMMTEAPLQCGFCVTEPSGGSDVSGMKTFAERRGDTYILNGQKIWITNGGIASWYFVLAKSADGFVGLIVDGDSPGVTRGKKEIMMGQRCSNTCAVTFENVEVPAANLLRDGFKLAMKTFDWSRPMVGMFAVGVARRAMEEATQYALQRKTMSKPIAEHQAVAFMLADMAVSIEASRLLSLKAAVEVDEGRRNSHLASMAKLVATEMCQKCVSDSLQIFGGNGYNVAYPLEKLYRDARIYTIYEGTSQIQKMIISRHLLEEARSKQ
jgi:acyl-CoA dehydrogenase